MSRRTKGDGTLFKRGDGYWVGGVTIDVNGKPTQKRVYSKTRNEAIRKLRELRKQIDAGQIPGTTTIKLEKWLDTWLHTIKKPEVDPTTFRSYEASVRLYIKPTLGRKRLDKLSTDDVRQMHTTLQTASPKGDGSTRNAQKAHQVLGMALTSAMAELGLTRNVADLVGMPKHLPKKPVSFPPEVALHVMTVAEASCDEMWAARWKCGFLTGKRECELLGLTWDRVDLTNYELDISWQLQELTKVHGCGEPTLDAKYPKGLRYPCGKKKVSFCPDAGWDFPVGFEYEVCEGNLVWTRPKSRNTQDVAIPIIPPLDSILERMLDHGTNPHNLVFHHPDGKPITQSQDQKAWQRLLKAANVPHVGQHTLRRTAATLMRKADVDEQTRMELFGHASVDVQRRYAGPDLQRHREAMGKLADILAPQDLDT